MPYLQLMGAAHPLLHTAAKACRLQVAILSMLLQKNLEIQLSVKIAPACKCWQLILFFFLLNTVQSNKPGTSVLHFGNPQWGTEKCHNVPLPLPLAIFLLCPSTQRMPTQIVPASHWEGRWVIGKGKSTPFREGLGLPKSVPSLLPLDMTLCHSRPSHSGM